MELGLDQAVVAPADEIRQMREDERKVELVNRLWILVYLDDRTPVVGECEDSFLVFGNQEDAEAGAEYQNDHYSIECIAIPLGELSQEPLGE